MCDLRFPRLNNEGLCKPRRVTKMVKKEIMNKTYKGILGRIQKSKG